LSKKREKLKKLHVEPVKIIEEVGYAHGSLWLIAPAE